MNILDKRQKAQERVKYATHSSDDLCAAYVVAVFGVLAILEMSHRDIRKAEGRLQAMQAEQFEAAI